MGDLGAIDYTPLRADNHVSRTDYIGSMRCLILQFLACSKRSTYSQKWGYLKKRGRETFAIVNGRVVSAELLPKMFLALNLEFCHGQSYSPVVSAQITAIIIDVFVYDTVVGSGKSEQMYCFGALQLGGGFQDYFLLQIEQGQGMNV